MSFLKSEGHSPTQKIISPNQKIKDDFPNDRFVITGHSLGGGIAIAAGGRVDVQAIGFSGPGSHFSRWRFGTTLERANRNSVNVVPEYDTVPKAAMSPNSLRELREASEK